MPRFPRKCFWFLLLINPQLSFYLDDDAISNFSVVISLLKFYSFLFFLRQSFLLGEKIVGRECLGMYYLFLMILFILTLHSA